MEKKIFEFKNYIICHPRFRGDDIRVMFFLKKLIPDFILNLYHYVIAFFAAAIYGFPSRKLVVIGVTGTNGKTTAVNLITKILEKAGYKAAMMSTINFKIGDKEWVNETKMTTPSSFYLQKFLSKAAGSGCKYAVLEISSHSLEQNRVAGINYQVGVFTNLTREHLDYHQNMEDYRDAKAKLFKKSKIHIVNLDDEYSEFFLSFPAKEKYGYGIKVESYEKFLSRSDFKTITAQNINLTSQGSNFKVLQHEINLKLLGEVNIYNALAAIAAGLSQNINLKVIKEALEQIKLIPGRMEFVELGQKFKIIIDYAVTPDSLEKLYQTIKRFQTAKLIWIFGSCGERDKGKRPIMGEIVGKRADYVIITNEDPYHEDPQQIIDQIFSGVIKSGKKENENVWRIFDRRQAIKKGLSLAQENDIVVITGKGAETIMAIGNEKIPWKERQVIEEELKKIR